MDGFLPSENMRFRDYSLSFNISEKDEEEIKSIKSYSYPKMVKSFDNKFRLCIENGGFSDSEIIVLLGENGTGKTTLIQLLAGKLQPDDLSGGENQWLKIMIAINLEASFYVFDEPLMHLDQDRRNLFWGLLKKIIQKAFIKNL